MTIRINVQKRRYRFLFHTERTSWGVVIGDRFYPSSSWEAAMRNANQPERLAFIIGASISRRVAR